MEQITKPHSESASKRKIARNERAAKRRKEERKERQRLKLTKTVVAEIVTAVVDQNKPITFEDLDGDQLVAYRGIHKWWDVQVQIGGVSNPLTIGGYAGTGKSTLLAIALPALKNKDGSNVHTKYCAYTGKAANVLAQKSLDSQTIHSLIYNPLPDKNGGVIFELKEREDIECELIVVDEASMVPDDMRKDLESLGIAILYTGDHGQLPPIDGQGNVMSDPEFKLETPHRQALESGIIQVASMVRNRERVRKGIYGKYSDARVVGKSAIDDIKLLSSADIVICQTNARRFKINDQVRKHRGFSGAFPKVGEKLICVKNNKLTNMFNGLIVTVLSVKYDGELLIMDLLDEIGNKYYDTKICTDHFSGEPHPRISGQVYFNLFEFAYAITGHKSQGSQWDDVIVIEESVYKQNMNIRRRWLYTTLTRAAKSLTWISKNN